MKQTAIPHHQKLSSQWVVSSITSHNRDAHVYISIKSELFKKKKSLNLGSLEDQTLYVEAM